MLSWDAREDARLVKRCRAGEKEAFAALVERYEDAVYNICYRMVGDREEARDLAQEAFVRAYEGLGGFRAGMPFRAWLFRIATNASIDHLRRRARKPEVARVSADGAELDEKSRAAEVRAVGRVPGPEETALASEVTRAVHGALAELPDNYRAAVVLYHLEGMSFAEVGSVLCVPRNTAKTWAHRGRAALAASLEGVI